MGAQKEDDPLGIKGQNSNEAKLETGIRWVPSGFFKKHVVFLNFIYVFERKRGQAGRGRGIVQSRLLTEQRA